jgi:hypothetical protein
VVQGGSNLVNPLNLAEPRDLEPDRGHMGSEKDKDGSLLKA